jgi:hypothetical protein
MSDDNNIVTENAMLYLVNVHRRLFLRHAFGINPDGTPIPNIDAPIKTYRAVKSPEQYAEIVRILTYWGDDEYLAKAPRMTLKCLQSGNSARIMKKLGTTTVLILNSCTLRNLMALRRQSLFTRSQTALSSICWTSSMPSYQHTKP